MSKDYREPEDFLSDESFLSWYFESRQKTDSSADGEWNRWMTADPRRKELVERAIALLDEARLRERELPAGQLRQAESALFQRIDTLRGGDAQKEADVQREKAVVTDAPATQLPAAGRTVPLYRNWRWAAAACILVVLVTGMAITRMMPSRQQQLATAYGQITVQQLPDGSEVTMNANSRLNYFKSFQEGTDREVWIDGEAFFHVRKTRLKSRFIVHTDRFDIVVTGTQFNVVNRRGKVNVMLREGSVIVHPQQGADMNMIPGDFVGWDVDGLKKTSVKGDSLLAWKQYQLFFDHTPLKEVVGIIEDQYGVKVTLQDQSIADSTISGIMQNNNLDVLLRAMEIATNFDVVRENGVITIKASSRDPMKDIR